MRCGDHVKHEPSGEIWVVAYVDGNDLAPCGWPDSIARTSDCVLIKAASDEQHLKMLREVANSKTGRRAWYAQAALDNLAVRGENRD